LNDIDWDPSDLDLPDDSQFEDYPEAHVRDEILDNGVSDFVLVDLTTHDHDHVGEQVLLFDRNHVKRDVFHVLKDYQGTLKKRHGMFETFMGLLRDAFFMVDKDEIEEKRKELAKILFEDPNSRCHNNQAWADAEAKRRLYCPSSKVLSDVPRKIPEPAELERRICAVVKLCANVPDAKTGEMFFSQQTWKVHTNVLKHVRLGCLSDVPGLDYYYTTTSPSGKTTLWSVRGTSQLEGFHKYLRRIFPGFHTSSRLATCLLAVFVYRWNIDRAVERGLLAERYGGWYNHEIILDLQQLSSQVDGEPIHDDFVNCNDFADTGERFYTPIVESFNMFTALTKEAIHSNLSPGMQFIAERDGSSGELTITAVLPIESGPMLGVINNSLAAAGNRNQRTRYDYAAAAVTWNEK
jgi:hypothetical protein